MAVGGLPEKISWCLGALSKSLRGKEYQDTTLEPCGVLDGRIGGIWETL